MARHKPLPVPPATDLDFLQQAWGARIDPELLNLALIHRSYANEAGGIPNNERLEFLGDSVLSIVIAQRLYTDYPDLPESDLSRMRAATVSQEPLAMAARTFNLGDYIYLGRGEDRDGGRDKPSILSDTFEALIGATYLTAGLETTREVIVTQLEFLLKDAQGRGNRQDWKTALVELAHREGLGEVFYEVTGEGPDHQRVYTAYAHVTGKEESLGSATETSKKHAENKAARAAVLSIDADFINHL